MIRCLKLVVILCTMIGAPALIDAASAEPPPAAPKGQNCRMEQQCKWVNFKKVCTYVKVCR